MTISRIVRKTRSITKSDAVIKAIKEFDRKGQKKFLYEYGFGPANRYLILYKSKYYDSKAILGVAFKYEYTTEKHLKTKKEIQGGKNDTAKHLEKLGFHIVDKTIPLVASDIKKLPGRVKSYINRIVRDTKLARDIKKLHKNKCQICSDVLNLNENKTYSEAHHIQPLGSKHKGLDISQNIICVCPNCHVKLDYGAIPLDYDSINKEKVHEVGKVYIEYHNNRIYKSIYLSD